MSVFVKIECCQKLQQIRETARIELDSGLQRVGRHEGAFPLDSDEGISGRPTRVHGGKTSTILHFRALPSAQEPR